LRCNQPRTTTDDNSFRISLLASPSSVSSSFSSVSFASSASLASSSSLPAAAYNLPVKE
jgi:hypothetical protein